MGADIEMKSSYATSTTTVVSRPGPIEISYLQRTLWVCNTFYYQILALVSILLLWIFFDEANSNGRTFTIHLVFSTAAYVPLMAAAIILFSEDNLTTLYIPRTKRYWIHGVLLLISCLAVTIGISVETQAKTQNKRDHFTSNHAIYGLASWILIFVSVICGIVAANTKSFSSFIKPVLAKLVHNVLGLAGFALGIASLWEMLHHVKSHLSESAYLGLQIGLIFVTIWSGLAALKSLYGQVKNVFS